MSEFLPVSASNDDQLGNQDDQPGLNAGGEGANASSMQRLLTEALRVSVCRAPRWDGMPASPGLIAGLGITRMNLLRQFGICLVNRIQIGLGIDPKNHVMILKFAGEGRRHSVPFYRQIGGVPIPLLRRPHEHGSMVPSRRQVARSQPSFPS